MVAQHDIVVHAQVSNNALALLQVGRRAFVVVIAEPVVEAQFVLAERQYAFGQAAGRHAVDSMGVRRANQVVARHVHRRMNGEARSVHAMAARIHQDVAVHIDFDQRGRGDLRKHHAERI